MSRLAAKKAARQPSVAQRKRHAAPNPKKGRKSKPPTQKTGQRNGRLSRRAAPGAGDLPHAGRTWSASTNRRGQVIEEDEFISDIFGSVDFTCLGLPVNPGQGGTFSWGSKVAYLYELYEFISLEFYFASSVSQFSANGQQGVLVLSADYDARDETPVSLRQVENSDPHTIPCLPSTPIVSLRLDCAQMRRGLAKYVRPGLRPVNTDIKTYDAANVYVSVSGCANATKIGELHVRYKCRLRKPVLNAVVDAGAAAHWSGLGTGVPLGPFNSPVEQSGTNPDVSLSFSTSILTFAKGMPGRYLLVYNITCAGAVPNLAAPVFTGGVVPYAYFCNNLARFVNTSVIGQDANPQQGVNAMVLLVPESGGTMSYAGSTFTGTTSWGWDLTVVCIEQGALGSSWSLEDRLQAQEATIARLESMVSRPSSPFDECDDGDHAPAGASMSPLPTHSRTRAAYHAASSIQRPNAYASSVVAPGFSSSSSSSSPSLVGPSTGHATVFHPPALR